MMAKPLEPTPVLEGKDREEFLKDLCTAKYNEDKERFLKECDELLKKVKCDCLWMNIKYS